MSKPTAFAQFNSHGLNQLREHYSAVVFKDYCREKFNNERLLSYAILGCSGQPSYIVKQNTNNDDTYRYSIYTENEFKKYFRPVERPTSSMAAEAGYPRLAA